MANARVGQQSALASGDWECVSTLIAEQRVRSSVEARPLWLTAGLFAMKVPPTSDPRWNDFVQGKNEYTLKCLASRIMYGQAKLLAQRDPGQAIRLAYEYFQKNEALAAEDLTTVFERGSNG
ncbi:MAG TPA: hypothetical protein VIV60_07330 [Polyangiaceae bacterium]